MFDEYANFANVKEHQALKNRIREAYLLNIKTSELISWGYHTYTIYLETKSGEKLIARISKNTTEKVETLERAIKIENLLNETLPTPKYIKNIANQYITEFEDHTIRLHKHIEGTPPFDMNMEIFEQMIDVLNKIHNFSNKTKGLSKLNLPVIDTSEPVLLHGDLTPSNVIVASNKISGVLDFENVVLGPVEYDLAYMAVFSWFRFKKADFTTLSAMIKKNYYNSINVDELNDYAKLVLTRHLNNIVKHKNDYTNQEYWQNEKDYFEKMYNRLLLELH